MSYTPDYFQKIWSVPAGRTMPQTADIQIYDSEPHQRGDSAVEVNAYGANIPAALRRARELINNMLKDLGIDD